MANTAILTRCIVQNVMGNSFRGFKIGSSSELILPSSVHWCSLASCAGWLFIQSFVIWTCPARCQVMSGQQISKFKHQGCTISVPHPLHTHVEGWIWRDALTKLSTVWFENHQKFGGEASQLLQMKTLLRITCEACLFQTMESFKVQEMASFNILNKRLPVSFQMQTEPAETTRLCCQYLAFSHWAGWDAHWCPQGSKISGATHFEKSFDFIQNSHTAEHLAFWHPVNICCAKSVQGNDFTPQPAVLCTGSH